MEPRWLGYFRIPGSCSVQTASFRPDHVHHGKNSGDITGNADCSPELSCARCQTSMIRKNRSVHVLAIPGYNEGVGVRCKKCGLLFCNDCARLSPGCPLCNHGEAVWYGVIEEAGSDAMASPGKPP